MNQVLHHNMLVRTGTAVGSEAIRKAAERGSQEAKKVTLKAFQDMFAALKTGRAAPPPGVSYQQLKKEVGVLVEAAQELQADDVLMHSRIESLLQKRIRDRGLDGLLALQARWWPEALAGGTQAGDGAAEGDGASPGDAAAAA